MPHVDETTRTVTSSTIITRHSLCGGRFLDLAEHVIHEPAARRRAEAVAVVRISHLLRCVFCLSLWFWTPRW
jgi:hypothetical protein